MFIYQHLISKISFVRKNRNKREIWFYCSLWERQKNSKKQNQTKQKKNRNKRNMCTILANKEKKMQLKSHKATTDPISHKNFCKSSSQMDGWQMRNGILLPKLFWPTVRKKNVLVIEKNFGNLRLKAENLTCSWRFFISNKSEQLKSISEKWLGFRSMQEKLEK